MKRKAAPIEPLVFTYFVTTRVVTCRAWERSQRREKGPRKGIAPSRSVRSRKAAILARKPLTACYHDDWEVMTGGGGGCDQFPEPTWHWLRCTQCGKEAPYDGPADGYDDHVGEYDGMDDWYV